MLHVVYEHDDFVILDKPAGVSFHSESGKGFVVMASEALGYPLYPVHRLDKMTSGLVLFARSSKAAAHFTTLFETRMIAKYYLAVSLRKPKKKQGWVKGDMAPSRRGSYKLLTTMDNPAITRFLTCSTRPNERLFLVRPHTGKTHQIRVALKSLGSPIAGDERYASKEEALKEARGYLHAFAMRFEYAGETIGIVHPPGDGERFITPECQDALKMWSEPWMIL
jgi:tRNA pseudouridine32 synthase/23S rRNA pseudouridine746 synthase